MIEEEKVFNKIPHEKRFEYLISLVDYPYPSDRDLRDKIYSQYSSWSSNIKSLYLFLKSRMEKKEIDLAKFPHGKEIYQELSTINAEYPPLLDGNWEEKHPFTLDFSKYAHYCFYKSWCYDDAVEIKETALNDLLLKKDPFWASLNLPKTQNHECEHWIKNEPLLFKVTFNADVQYDSRYSMEICYSETSSGVQHSLLNIYSGYNFDVDYLLKFCVPFWLSMNSNSIDPPEYSKPELAKFLALSHLRETSEALKAILFLTAHKPANTKKDLAQLFPFLFNYIFSWRVKQTVWREEPVNLSSDFLKDEKIQKSVREFFNKDVNLSKVPVNLINGYLFSRDDRFEVLIYPEAATLIKSKIDEMYQESVKEFFTHNVYLPAVLVNFINGYFSPFYHNDHHEILIHPEIGEIYPDSNKEINFTPDPDLNFSLKVLQNKQILEDDIKFVGCNVAYDEYLEKIIPENGHFLQLSYRDLLQLYAFLNFGILIPMYHLEYLAKKNVNLGKACRFLNTLDEDYREPVLQEIFRLSSDEQTFVWKTSTREQRTYPPDAFFNSSSSALSSSSSSVDSSLIC